jgi:hypothetical protein
VSDAATYRDLADAAWSWTLDQVRDDDGPWLPESVDEGEPQAAAAWDRDGLYVGISGMALALAEVVQHRSSNSASPTTWSGGSGASPVPPTSRRSTTVLPES